MFVYSWSSNTHWTASFGVLLAPSLAQVHLLTSQDYCPKNNLLSVSQK